jgi:hypothetical protein
MQVHDVSDKLAGAGAQATNFEIASSTRKAISSQCHCVGRSESQGGGSSSNGGSANSDSSDRITTEATIAES